MASSRMMLICFMAFFCLLNSVSSMPYHIHPVEIEEDYNQLKFGDDNDEILEEEEPVLEKEDIADNEEFEDEFGNDEEFEDEFGDDVNFEDEFDDEEEEEELKKRRKREVRGEEEKSEYFGDDEGFEDDEFEDSEFDFEDVEEDKDKERRKREVGILEDEESPTEGEEDEDVMEDVGSNVDFEKEDRDAEEEDILIGDIEHDEFEQYLPYMHKKAQEFFSGLVK